MLFYLCKDFAQGRLGFGLCIWFCSLSLRNYMLALERQYVFSRLIPVILEGMVEQKATRLAALTKI